MKMSMTLDAASAASLKAFRATVEQGLPRIAERGKKYAHLMALAGANAGIYLTPAGRRERTGFYRDSIGAASAINGAEMIVEVFDTAEYAQDLEYGRVLPLTAPQAEQLAEALGDGAKPLYMGRSGQLWIKPNPAITRAAIYANLRMQNALGSLLAGAVVP